MRYFFLFLYYAFFRHLPHSTVPLIGPVSESLRYRVCRHFFKKCGKNVNIGSKARFGKGFEIEIGNNSGIGINAKVPSDIKIGNDVMMGVNVTIIGSRHVFDRIDIPMRLQGYEKMTPVIIEDDVWIGNNVIILPGRKISKGTIIGAGAVVTKDFPPYSVIGGNPARLLKSRV